MKRFTSVNLLALALFLAPALSARSATLDVPSLIATEQAAFQSACGPREKIPSTFAAIGVQESDAVHDQIQVYDLIVRDQGEDASIAALKQKHAYLLKHCWALQNDASTLGSLAQLYSDKGQYEEAARWNIRKAAFYLYWSGGNPVRDYEAGNNRLDLADNLEQLSDFRGAENQIRAALTIFQGLDISYTRRGQVKLAANLNHQSRWREAEATMNQVGTNNLDDLGGGWDSMGYQAMAEALDGQGRYKEALPFWRKVGDEDLLLAALDRAGEKSESADLYGRQLAKEKEDEALANEGSSASSSPTAEQQAQENETMAQLYAMQAGDFEKKGDRETARKLRELAAYYRENNTQDNASGASPLADEHYVEEVELGRRYYDAGRYDEARAQLEKACPGSFYSDLTGQAELTAEILKTSGIPIPSTADCYYLLALAQAKASKTNPKVLGAAFVSAQYAMQSRAGTAINQASARELAEREGAGDVLTQLLAERAAVDVATKAFFAKWPMEKIVAAVMAAQTDQHDFIDYSYDAMLFGKQLSPRRANVIRLTNTLRQSAPDYFRLVSPDPIALDKLQQGKLLKENEAMVLWMVTPGSDRGLVFAISPTAAGWAEMTLTGDAISERVKRLRQQISPCSGAAQSCNLAPTRFDRQAAWELYGSLLGLPGIQKVLNDGKVDTLLIVPTGALTTLPPALLITQAPQGGAAGDADPNRLRHERWLIADAPDGTRGKAVAILPGVASLITLRQTAKPAATGLGGLYMFADPNFSGTDTTAGICASAPRAVPQQVSTYFASSGLQRQALARLPRLPCTRIEGEALKTQIGGDLFVDKEARERRLHFPADVAKLSQARVVAFATHGLVSGEVGLGEPGLVLAAPLKGEPDDGLLTTTEIAELRLSADWVLLSACNTASPDSNDAEGLSGMSRAFFFAGAKSMMVSHWPIDDVAAQALVIKSVQLRQQGLPKAEALRQASLLLINGQIGPADDSQVHPAAWAPFTLMGDPN